MTEKTSRLALESFETHLSDINDVPIEDLHALSIAVRWPHRAEDWEMLRRFGRGYAVRDEIGRVLATAMWFAYGGDFATIGMMITAPRLQTHGAGRWVMEHVIAASRRRFMGLNATRAGRRLYASLGFVAEQTTYQCQGEAIAPQDAVDLRGGLLRPLTAGDLPELLALDRAAFGADRAALYDLLLPVSSGLALVRGGEIRAFAVCRPFGRGHVVGPVIAATAADAIAVSAPHIADHAGQFTRLDTREGAGPFQDFLVRSGLSIFDTVTTMSLGRPFVRPVEVGEERLRVFGLASHALS